ncbi:MAG: hypothetical protein LUD79_07585 [Oscillospiraceae bacterium]|nr:hypothetical protein [Oscillospiraceae bacterium]
MMQRSFRKLARHRQRGRSDLLYIETGRFAPVFLVSQETFSNIHLMGRNRFHMTFFRRPGTGFGRRYSDEKALVSRAKIVEERHLKTLSVFAIIQLP